MARRVKAGKASSRGASQGEASAEDRLVDAALAVAARQGWRSAGLGEIAHEAGLTPAEAYAACRSKPAILLAWHRRIDRAALAGAGAAGEEPARDRLFDLLMRRFDVLQPHRAALRVILRDSFGDPAALCGVPALLGSMAWMLEGAGVSTAGLRGRLRSKILMGLYFSVLRVFLQDDSADLTRTMAALDRRLRRAESWLGLGRPIRGEGAAAST